MTTKFARLSPLSRLHYKLNLQTGQTGPIQYPEIISQNKVTSFK